MQRRIFHEIDQALNRYYQSVAISDYLNSDGVGKFLQFTEENEMDEEDIDDELQNLENCQYSEFDPNFPYNGNEQSKQKFIFDLIKKCYINPNITFVDGIEIKDAINIPSKTSFAWNWNGAKRNFYPSSMESILKSCELIKMFGLDGIGGLIDVIAQYAEQYMRVCFGDIISIQRIQERASILTVDGQTKFKIIKCIGIGDRSIFHSKQPVHYGENFLLKSIFDNKYVQRDKIANDDRKTVHKTIRFKLGMIDINEEIKYKQTVQFDIADKSVMSKIVRYDRKPIGLTFGGNYPMNQFDDHKNPYNNFRTWLTVRGTHHDCVVSWFGTDERMIITKH